VCVDYRGISKDTVPDCYSIPRIDDLIDNVGRQKIVHYPRLDEGVSPDNLTQSVKLHLLAFGLTNAPATFQRLMNQLFGGCSWSFVFVYLDDLLIVSKSFQEHLEHVDKVLTRLGEAGLRLKPGKCSFVQERVEYLGHTLSSTGVSENDRKVQAVNRSAARMFKSFLGLVNFYQKHIPNLAALARPLTALTRKDRSTGSTVKFQWTDTCEEAFMELKERPPDMTKPFFVWTDASLEGFGAVLEHIDLEGQRHPIAYASRQTNLAEAKYAPTQLKVAALVFAVDLGNVFTVYTDHQALVSAFLVHLKSQTSGLLA